MLAGKNNFTALLSINIILILFVFNKHDNKILEFCCKEFKICVLKIFAAASIDTRFQYVTVFSERST